LQFKTFHALLEDYALLVYALRKKQQLSKKPWMAVHISKEIRKRIKDFITKSKHMIALFINNQDIFFIGQ